MARETRLPADDIVHADNWSNGRCDLMPMTATRPLSDLLTLMGSTRAGGPHEPDLSLPIWQVRAGASLLHEGARSSHVYVVRAGTFKCIKTAEDGYEQVLAFAGQGEVLAFEAMCGDAQRMGAVALEDSSVYALPTREIDGWRRLSPRFDHVLQVALSRQLTRAGQITEMMAAVSSDVRLARFLIWWSNRMAERGQSPRRLLLRMSRRDIASLLGVAHETVSRSFSSFVEHGLLRVDNREIEIVDFAGLKARTRNTRGLVDEASRFDGLGRSEATLRTRSHRVDGVVAVAH